MCSQNLEMFKLPYSRGNSNDKNKTSDKYPNSTHKPNKL